MKRKVLSVLLCAGLAVSMLAGCGSDSSNANKKAESTGSDLEYVKDKGTLVVGVTDFEPMDYKDDNGEWVGFDADMAKAFAESIGVEAEFVEIDWDNKELELDGKSIDCVWNGMTLTDEVESSMECTDAYMNNAQVVVVPADKADKYQDEDSVKDLTFAVEAGSAGEEQVNRIGAQYTAVSSQADALMEVASGNSDAAAIDALMAAAMIGEGTGYADLTYTISLNDEEYGVGFRKGSDLAAALNDYFKKSMEDGSMKKCAETYNLGWSFNKMELIMEQFPIVIHSLNVGFLQTLKLFFATLLGAIPLGLVIAFGSMSHFKPLSYITNIIVWIVRGTPLMIQMLIIYYFPGLVLGNPIWGGGESGRFLAASVAFIFNYACYFSVIYRGGIQGIPQGQTEAGLVLGMTKHQIFFKVKLLQMVKRIVPPMSNEIITLVKDTSLARIIALQEIIWAGQAFLKGSQGISGAIWPMFFTAFYYLIFNGILTVLLGKLEKKLEYFN